MHASYEIVKFLKIYDEKKIHIFKTSIVNDEAEDCIIFWLRDCINGLQKLRTKNREHLIVLHNNRLLINDYRRTFKELNEKIKKLMDGSFISEEEERLSKENSRLTMENSILKNKNSAIKKTLKNLAKKIKKGQNENSSNNS